MNPFMPFDYLGDVAESAYKKYIPETELHLDLVLKEFYMYLTGWSTQI